MSTEMNRTFDVYKTDEFDYPVPTKAMRRVATSLLNGSDSKEDRLNAARIVQAYLRILGLGERDRSHVASELRKLAAQRNELNACPPMVELREASTASQRPTAAQWAATRKLAQQLFEAGATPASIARQLNTDGRRTKVGLEFTAQIVKNLLRGHQGLPKSGPKIPRASGYMATQEGKRVLMRIAWLYRRGTTRPADIARALNAAGYRMLYGHDLACSHVSRLIRSKKYGALICGPGKAVNQ